MFMKNIFNFIMKIKRQIVLIVKPTHKVSIYSLNERTSQCIKKGRVLGIFLMRKLPFKSFIPKILTESEF